MQIWVQRNSIDIKCRKAGIKPDAVVLVATVRALKYNGGVAKDRSCEPKIWRH